MKVTLVDVDEKLSCPSTTRREMVALRDALLAAKARTPIHSRSAINDRLARISAIEKEFKRSELADKNEAFVGVVRSAVSREMFLAWMLEAECLVDRQRARSIGQYVTDDERVDIEIGPLG